MKAGNSLALAMALLAGQAWTQSALSQPKSEISSNLPPLEQLPLRLQLKLDPKLPPLPDLKVTQPSRVEIRVLQTYRGPIFQLEVVRKNVAEVLEGVVAAMGAQAVSEPVLKRSHYQTAVFRALTLEELLVEVSQGSVEIWKSSAGVYFFAHKPNPTIQKMLGDLVKPEPFDQNADPFIFGPKRKEPEADWSKFPFNDRDVFVVPLPTK